MEKQFYISVAGLTVEMNYLREATRKFCEDYIIDAPAGKADLIATTYNFVTGASTGGAYGPAYLVGGALFFCVCYPLSMMAGRWGQRLKERDKGKNEPTDDGAKEAAA